MCCVRTMELMEPLEPSVVWEWAEPKDVGGGARGGPTTKVSRGSSTGAKPVGDGLLGRSSWLPLLPREPREPRGVKRRGEPRPVVSSSIIPPPASGITSELHMPIDPLRLEPIRDKTGEHTREARSVRRAVGIFFRRPKTCHPSPKRPTADLGPMCKGKGAGPLT